MPNQSKARLFTLPQILLFILAFFILALGIMVSPEHMIALGPLSKSLTSDIPEVKQLAYTEVKLLKILLYIFAFSLIAIASFWKRIINSSIIQRINNHIPNVVSANEQSLGLSKKSFLIILGCFFVGFIYMKFGNQLFTRIQLYHIQHEDGLIESASAIILILCSILSAILAFKLSSHRARMIMHLILAFIFFFMAGEEISWGQRIFKLETLEMLKDSNVQNEINLHNMFGYLADHLFIVAILIYGFIMPVLAYFYVFYRNLFDLLGIPIASLGLAIGFLLASAHQRWIVSKFIDLPSGFRIEELRELFVAIALLILMYESWQLSRKETHGVGPTY